MNRTQSIFLLLLAAFGLLMGFQEAGASDFRFFDIEKGSVVSDAEALETLRSSRVVVVGEHHTTREHHLAQLRVIEMLHKAGTPVAVGLEMFRRADQPALDDWVAGTLPLEDFQRIYYESWAFPWPLYNMIFEYARDRRIPLVGLNVDRDVTRQVAKGGFVSLTEDQKGKLADVTCNVTQEYMEYIRRAFGAHAHGDLNFIYFCEAQLVWDNVMALNAVDFLKAHPETVMVILAGTGHARKMGIPLRIRERSDLSVTVILPEAPGRIEPGTVDAADADLLMLGP